MNLRFCKKIVIILFCVLIVGGVFSQNMPVQLEEEQIKTLNEANQLLRAGKNEQSYKTAKNLYQQTSAEDAAYIAGLAAINLQYWNEAESLLKTVTSPAKMEFARYYTAYSRYRQAKYTQASADFSAFIKDFPRSVLYRNAAYNGALAAIQASQTQTALNLAQQAYSASITQEAKIQSAVLLAELYADSNKTDQAISLLKTYAAAESALWSLSLIYAKNNRVLDAQETWKELIRKYPNGKFAEDAAFRQAELYFSTENWVQSIDFFEQYRTLYPRGRYTDAALYYQAASLENTNRPTEALLLRQYLISLFPNSVYSTNAQSKIVEAVKNQTKPIVSQNRFDVEYENLKKASLNLDKNRESAALAAFNLGTLLREENNFAKAADFLLMAAEYYAPINREKAAQSLYGTVESYDRIGSIANAKAAFKVMQDTYPLSVWTERAKEIAGGW